MRVTRRQRLASTFMPRHSAASRRFGNRFVSCSIPLSWRLSLVYLYPLLLRRLLRSISGPRILIYPLGVAGFFFFNKLHPLVVDDFKEADVLDLASSLHFQHYRWGNTRFGIEE